MKNFHWLIPPMLGLAAFYSARATHFRERSQDTVSADRQTREERKDRDVAGIIAGFERDLAEAGIQREEEVNAMSAGALRERVLELRRKMAAFDSESDWGVVERAEIDLRRAARQLGKLTGLDGLEWIRAEAPELLASAMMGVTEANPDLALREIIASKTQDPCFAETLMGLLQRQAEKGPAALAAACKAVPWELNFRQTDDPFGGSFELPADTDLAPWIESGAALALAEDGVQLGNLFSLWAKLDPVQALEHWENWPDARSNGARSRVAEIFTAGMQRDDDRNRIAAVFGKLPDVERSKVINEIQSLRQTHRHWAGQLEARFPMLVPPEKEAAK